MLNAYRWWKIRKSLSTIKLLALDVDGVLTDRGLFYSSSQQVLKRFDVRDGLGIRLLQDEGIIVAFVSGGRGGSTELRAQHLGVEHCYVNVNDKVSTLTSLCQKTDISPHNIAFVGDDLNDFVVRGSVGLLIATKDAAKPLILNAHARLNSLGGHGAVREVAERILRARHCWHKYKASGWRDLNG